MLLVLLDQVLSYQNASPKNQNDHAPTLLKVEDISMPLNILYIF